MFDDTVPSIADSPCDRIRPRGAVAAHPETFFAPQPGPEQSSSGDPWPQGDKVCPTPGPSRLSPHELGARGELRARDSLARRGWEILDHNWRSPYGEVDIVARDPDAPASTVVLIEVKTRFCQFDDEVLPEEAVDLARRERYTRAAVDYLRDSGWAETARFDVIAIMVRPDGRAHLSHRKHAFEGIV